jgi:hypothetical protein
MIEKMFGTKKPIIAMVHMQYKGNLTQLISETLRDVDRLQRRGIDGLLFENWGGDSSDRFISPETREQVSEVIKSMSRMIKLPYGINLLPLDYEADFDIAKETGANFVQIDTFVDKVRTDYDNQFVIDIRPQEVVDYKNRLNLDNVALFTNIQTKHYRTIPTNKRLETSAMQAVQNGADVLVVTGESTGRKTPIEKIVRVKSVVGDVPVFVGSGFDVSNAQELLPHADGVILGTSLKYDGVTENPVDEGRVKQLMELVYKLRD